jgi:hypothetical protein
MQVSSMRTPNCIEQDIGLRILYRGKAESLRRRQGQISPGLYWIHLASFSSARAVGWASRWS